MNSKLRSTPLLTVGRISIDHRPTTKRLFKINKILITPALLCNHQEGSAFLVPLPNTQHPGKNSLSTYQKLLKKSYHSPEGGTILLQLEVDPKVDNFFQNRCGGFFCFGVYDLPKLLVPLLLPLNPLSRLQLAGDRSSAAVPSWLRAATADGCGISIASTVKFSSSSTCKCRECTYRTSSSSLVGLISSYIFSSVPYLVM